MKIPVKKGFSLGCYKWKVKSDIQTDKKLQSEHRYGACDFGKRTLEIGTDYNEDQYHSTFIHEIIEAINEEDVNGKLKHDEVTNLANGMSQVMKSLGVVFSYD